MNLKEGGLFLKKLTSRKALVIDPDNLFWAITESSDTYPFISYKLWELYHKVKLSCRKEIDNFRFSSSLAAVYIDPTDRCNLNCSYCYIPPQIRKQGRSLKEKELIFILNKTASYFKKKKRKGVIVFHASEPLLVKDIIFSAIEKFKKYFYFGIQTNALLLNKEDVEFLKSNKVSMGISLDSYKGRAHNRVRVYYGSKENFKKVIQVIDWFEGYRGLNIITTITKFNVRDLPSLVNFLHRKKVSCILMNPLRFTQKYSLSLRPDENTMSKYFIKAVKEAIRLSKNSSHRIIIGNFSNILLGIISPSSRRLMCDISPCGGGRCFLTITAAGDIIPCGEFIGIKKFYAGNIFRDSIEKVMQSLVFKRIRERVVERIEECNSCLWRNLCGAPCPAELYNLGDMYKKSVFCEFYKRVISYAWEVISKGEEKYCLREEGLKKAGYKFKL